MRIGQQRVSLINADVRRCGGPGQVLRQIQPLQSDLEVDRDAC